MKKSNDVYEEKYFKERYKEVFEKPKDYINPYTHTFDFKEFLAPQQSDIIIDVGCGLGYNTYRISKHVNKIIGIDISSYAISKAREWYNKDNVEFKTCDLTNLSSVFEPNYFDAAICIDLIEHLDDKSIKKMFYSLKTVLKNGGRVIIENPVNEVTRYKPFLRRIVTFLGKNYDDDWTHINNISIPKMERLLSEAGFVIETHKEHYRRVARKVTKILPKSIRNLLVSRVTYVASNL